METLNQIGPPDLNTNSSQNWCFPTIPWAERPEHLFFGDYEDQPFSRRFDSASDADFRSGDSDGDGRNDSTIQFDYKDRLFDQQLISLILTNKLIKKEWFGKQSRYSQIAFFSTLPIL